MASAVDGVKVATPCRHSSLNNIIHRAMSAAKIPARLESSGLARSDGKRPDCISMVPWKEGKLLVWGCYIQRHLGMKEGQVW